MTKFHFLQLMESFVAACCNEAFKIATSSAAYLNNYFMLIGTEGIYSYTFEHEKRDDCPVCGGEAQDMSISSEMTVEEFIEMLTEKQDMYVLFSVAVNVSLIYVFSVKSRSLPYRRPPNRYIYRRLLSWRKLLDPTLARKFQSWWSLEARSLSQLLRYLSVFLCAFSLPENQHSLTSKCNHCTIRFAFAV